uniref:flagellar biosynthesis protein FlhF n=1 Tax=Agathobacter sp. TaxID=2021311 RepID=UPI00405605B1
MTINKFQGKTENEAIEKAKLEFGPNAVIMNVKEIKPKGLFKFFQSSTYEVTAAIEDNYIQARDGFLQQETAKKPEPSIRMQASEHTQMASVMKEIQSIKNEEEKQFKQRLDNLSEMLEQKLGTVQTDSSADRMEIEKPQDSEEMNFVRILYSTLLNNEVNEKYVNQIMDEVEKFIRPGNSIDTILSNVYQKMILKFGQPSPIDVTGKKPNVIFFIGPTGVGKTTTIAKIASKYKVDHNMKVAFITSDTYRIAATEQLRIYANILDSPMSIVYTVDEVNQEIEKYMDYDLIFVDTAGFSHKNEKQKADMKFLISGVNDEYKKEVYLVVSATIKYKDLLDIVDTYHEISDYKLIFTKLDETSCYGNILNIKLYSGADLSYVTNGQNVPDDIEVFDTQKVVKQLLGGR